MTMKDIPHLHIVVGACIVAAAGYAAFSFYAVVILKDPAMTGDVIGTWKSFAVAAFAFWLGSSSGGKAATTGPAGTFHDPVVVEGAGAHAEPVPTTVEPDKSSRR